MITTQSPKTTKQCACKNHKHCLHCNKLMRNTAVTYNGYCMHCWNSACKVAAERPENKPPTGYKVLKGRKKCIVLGCENWTDQGAFKGDLCCPCHRFVTAGEGQYSQAYRNSLQLIARRLLSRTSLRRMEEMLVSDLDPTHSLIGRRGSYISEADLDKLTG